MLRYIAVVWDSKNPAAHDAAASLKRRIITALPTWRTSADCSGLVVWSTGHSQQSGDCLPLPGESGVILGTVFERDEAQCAVIPRRVVSINEHTTKAIVSSSGRSLVDTVWGSYVMLLRLSGSEVRVLRGPMGSLSCFWIRIGDCTVFFSRVEDCYSLQLIPFTVNWDCIRAQAVGGDYLCGETAIAEIQTLVSGECVALAAGDLSRTLYWNPARISNQPAVRSLDDAAKLLRNTTQSCIDAWSSAHETILLELSGGFDSSVLLGCMSHSELGRRVVGVNLWSGRSADERRYARSMAKKTETELVELELDPNADLRRVLDCARTGNPVVHFSAFDIEPRLIRLARERNATAIFTGELGDDILGHSPAPEVLAECLATDGFGLRLLNAAVDYGTLTRISVWSAVRDAVRYKLWQDRNKGWSLHNYKRFRGFNTGSCLAYDEAVRDYEHDQTRFIHPWLLNVEGTPMGRIMLIWASILCTSTWTHSPFAGLDSSLFVHPLVSQPLFEAFCRIPSRLHFMYGENGAVARRAFGNYLSADVLARGTSKGSPDLWIKDVISRNRGFMREMLLDGMLVREQVLDRGKLEDALSPSVTHSQVGVSELIMQLYVECWLRQWLRPEARAVA